MDKIALGIIGVGHLGRYHLACAKKVPFLKVVGIYDKDFNRMEDIAREYEVDFFESIEGLLQKCDAVSIVVPTKDHFSVGVKAIEARCHVFMEKPITAKVEEAKELIELAKRENLKLQVGHIERFNPAFLSLCGLELSPMFIEAHRLSEFNPRGTDVSVILDIMIHDLDIVLKLINSPISFLHACGVGVVSPSEDIANVRIEFENGAVANLTASRISAKHMRKMRLFQRDQYISIDFLNKKSEILSLKDVTYLKEKGFNAFLLGEIGEGTSKKDVYFVSPPTVDVNSLQLELEEFARSIREDTDTKVTGEDGLKALELAHEIIKLMKKPVK